MHQQKARLLYACSCFAGSNVFAPHRLAVQWLLEQCTRSAAMSQSNPRKRKASDSWSRILSVRSRAPSSTSRTSHSRALTDCG